MNSSNKLSPMAGYYVRRLIQQHKELLLQTATNAMQPEGTVPEPEEILNRLITNPSERLQRINNLEILARAYQNLAEDGRHPEQLKAVEKQVLQLLGVSSFEGEKKTEQVAKPDTLIRKEYTIAKVVEILQALLKCGEMYLGPRISRTYFVVSCPASLQLNGFSFNEDGQLKVSRAMTEILQSQEIEDIKQWIKLYINRCSGIILGFDSLVNQEHLAYCSISRQEIQLAE
jgi:hypothetical protein